MTQDDRDRIRLAYETGSVSQRELAESCGVTTRTLRNWARKEGWVSPRTRRPPVSGEVSGTVSGNLSGKASGKKAESPSERLMKTFEVQIREMEARMHDPETAMTESDARTLNTLARTFEKLHAMELDQAHDDSGRSLETLRKELAARLNRLRENT